MDVPSSKHNLEQAGKKSERAATKKRSIEESRAAAREWNLEQRKVANESQLYKSDTDTPSSSKKPRRGSIQSPAMKKAEAREKSRQRAREYAQTLLPPSKIRPGGNTLLDGTPEAEGREAIEVLKDEEDREDEEEDTYMSMSVEDEIRTDSEGTQRGAEKPHESLGGGSYADHRPEDSWSAPLSSSLDSHSPAPSFVPPFPESPVPSLGSIPRQSPLPVAGAGGRMVEPSPLQSIRRRPTSFLRHAYSDHHGVSARSTEGSVSTPAPGSVRKSRSSWIPTQSTESGEGEGASGWRLSTAGRPGDGPSREGPADSATRITSHGGVRRGGESARTVDVTPRKSFLDAATPAKKGTTDKSGQGKTLAQKPTLSMDKEAETETKAKKEINPAPVAGVSVPSRDQKRARLFTNYTGTLVLVLAPSMLLAVVLGVLVPAWSNVRLAAGGAWNGLSRLGKIPTFREKCYLSSGEDPSVCKEGTEPTDCPRSAICSRGHVLYCDKMFEKASDGRSCKVSKAVKEEASLVAEALRELTTEKMCTGGLLLVPDTSRMCITLNDVATMKQRGPLTLLAAMPAGNVDGILDLEATEDGRPDFGRIARLSESAVRKIRVPWRCRARLLVGKLLLTHWKAPYEYVWQVPSMLRSALLSEPLSPRLLVNAQILLASYGLLMVILYLDVRRWTAYRRRIKVCLMRDEAYKALLDNTAKDPSPMQESHIQAYVGDRQRAGGDQGSTAQILKAVRKQWSQVEKEVEHDTRIRRNYINVRGQHNVPCWQWVGPSSASFESIGTQGVLPAFGCFGGSMKAIVPKDMK